MLFEGKRESILMALAEGTNRKVIKKQRGDKPTINKFKEGISSEEKISMHCVQKKPMPMKASCTQNQTQQFCSIVGCPKAET